MPRRRVRRGSVEVGKDTRVGILIRREGGEILVGWANGRERKGNTSAGGQRYLNVNGCCLEEPSQVGSYRTAGPKLGT